MTKAMHDGISTGETWKRIPGWRHYEVSDQGRVRRGSQILKPQCRNGYLRVKLRRRGKSPIRKWRPIHQLVLEAFKGPRDPGQETRHLDGDRANNCRKNLAWGYPHDNEMDKVMARVRRTVETLD